MKKIIYFATLAICLCLVSCSQKVTQFSQSATLLDLREFTNDGFFISESNSVGFDYQAIGIMTVIEISGEDKTHVVTKEEIKRDIDDDLYYTAFTKKLNKNWKSANGFSALSELVRLAKDEGANGIINLTIKYNYLDPDGKPAHLISVETSGMLIKR